MCRTGCNVKCESVPGGRPSEASPIIVDYSVVRSVDITLKVLNLLFTRGGIIR